MVHCTRELFEGQVIGDACPDCGHTNVVHPGEHNPVIDHCVLCVLVTLAEQELSDFVGSPKGGDDCDEPVDDCGEPCLLLKGHDGIHECIHVVQMRILD